MKTNELTGVALDWAVAEASGTPIYRSGKTLSRMDVDGGIYWQPSTDWSQGGPIIEREEIGVQCVPAGTSQGWWAIKDSTFHDRSRPDEMRGDTPLIAAMRCYVASKLGDDIELPKELT